MQIQKFLTYIMYTVCHWIFNTLDIQFFCKTRHSIHISRTQLPFNFRSFGYSKFLQIQKFRIYYVYNFSFNLCSSGHSILLQIQTFRTFIMYTILHWIYGVLDIQIFLLIQTYRTHITYLIFRWIFAALEIKFFCKSRYSVYIT